MRLAFRVIIATFSIAAAGSAQSAPDADALSARALEAYDGGDTVLAALLWRQGARAGSAEAMTALGGLIEEGDGVAHDPAAARRWYARAARRGDVQAMVLLAETLRKTDPARAAQLYYRAAARGHAFAKRRLAASPGPEGESLQGASGE